MKLKSEKKDEFGNRICDAHSQGFSRIHSRIDIVEKDNTRIDTFLFGNAERGIDGFVQKDLQWKTRMEIYMKIAITFLSALFIGMIPVIYKMFFSGVK